VAALAGVRRQEAAALAGVRRQEAAALAGVRRQEAAALAGVLRQREMAAPVVVTKVGHLISSSETGRRVTLSILLALDGVSERSKEA
jgi:hypothetical protein